jgi:Cu/Zn superoxide dismutase
MAAAAEDDDVETECVWPGEMRQGPTPIRTAADERCHVRDGLHELHVHERGKCTGAAGVAQHNGAPEARRRQKTLEARKSRASSVRLGQTS